MGEEKHPAQPLTYRGCGTPLLEGNNINKMIRDIIKEIKKNWRIHLIIGTFFIFALLSISRFYNLQIAQREKFSAKASSQFNDSQSEWQRLRGKIYFQDYANNQLTPVAINKDFWFVFVVPEEILDDEKGGVSKKLSQIFDLEEEEIMRKVSKTGDLFEMIAEKVDDEKIREVKSLSIKGVYADKEIKRFYPYGELAAQTIGFVRDDIQNFSGQYGVERYYDDKLSVSEGGFLGIATLKNAIFGRRSYDLISTIDFNIQFKAEKLLKDSVLEQDATGGSVIVLDPKTGKLLAMANYPSFDPNNYSQYSLDNFTNPSVEATYEPGSTFKLLTVAAGLESNKITPTTTYQDRGEVRIDGRTIRNWDLKSHGVQSVSDVLAKSLNTGVVFIENLMGHDIFYHFMKNFRVDQKTGIDLPGEVYGNISNLKGFQDIYFATASFGQGVSVTPLGLLSSLSSIANGGVEMKPFVIDKMRDISTGEELSLSYQEGERLMSEDTSRMLRVMLVNAVEENMVAKIEGYNVAGKTGTAQVPDDTGNYSEMDTIHSFFGFAPAENPRFSILVKIDRPKRDRFAGQTAIPIFKELAEYILRYYQIPRE